MSTQEERSRAPHRRVARALATASCFAALALGACGDDGGGDENTSATATSPTSTTGGGQTQSTTDATGSGSSSTTQSPGSSSSSSSSEAGTESSSGGSSSDSGGSTLTGIEILSYAADIEPIVLENCGAGGICHQSMAAPASEMLLAEGAGYDSIVGVASVQVPELMRVQPDAPGQSYLVNKILGTGSSVGGGPSRMPLGGMLTDDEILMFRVWIAGGAMP